jgi:aminomethyltransferase
MTSAAHSEALVSPLHDRHVALGAKLGDFGGWLMPLEYPGGGVVEEHRVVRERVGLFDVSHLGKFTVRGPGARALIDLVLTNDTQRIAPGRAQYSMLCNEAGGVVDDLYLYVNGDDDVFVIPNASNASTVVAAVSAAAPAAVEVTNRHRDFAIIAVQGPRSAGLLDAVGLPSSMKFTSFLVADRGGVPVQVCRTGYSGEHGYEIVLPADAAAQLWDDLLELGQPFGVLPCGLGARDTLRTEMGYPLHGQDLSPSITPVQAGTIWAVGWQKPAFIGRAALIAELAAGPTRRAWGLLALDRGIPRAHMQVRRPSDTEPLGGEIVGEVTSGTFSPTLKVGIGLALLDAAVTEGDDVVIDVRGRASLARVVKPPFVSSNPR